MKTLLHLFLITALIAVSQFASASELQDKVESLTQEIMPKVIEWRRDFHAHPELSNREERTGRVVAEHLREMGIETSRRSRSSWRSGIDRRRQTDQ